MLTIVAMKWKRNTTGMMLPAVCDYGADHVNRLYSALKRNLTIPFRFVLISDDFSGVFSAIEKIQIWDTFKELGGCYRRLFLFSPAIKKYLGERFVSIDLDCVITGNVDSVFSRKEDFVINRYPFGKGKCATQQWYNGGLFMMNSGCRSIIWDTFCQRKEELLKEISIRIANKEIVGSDQAIIAHLLGPNEAVFDESCGVFDYGYFPKNGNGKELNKNAKIVLFPGKRDPSTEYSKNNWIKENWR